MLTHLAQLGKVSKLGQLSESIELRGCLSLAFFTVMNLTILLTQVSNTTTTSVASLAPTVSCSWSVPLYISFCKTPLVSYLDPFLARMIRVKDSSYFNSNLGRRNEVVPRASSSMSACLCNHWAPRQDVSTQDSASFILAQLMPSYQSR